MSRLPIFFSTCVALALTSLAPAQSLTAPPVSITPTSAPAKADALQPDLTGSLSLVPQRLPLPPDFVIGTGPTQPEAHAFPSLVTPPSTPSIPLLDEIGKVIDFANIQWPLGEALEGHFMLPNDHPIGNWVPFLSVLQDNDELDTHIRNGIGVGATYRFSKNARVEVQVQYLDGSGDVNPAIGHETRASLIFSFDF